MTDDEQVREALRRMQPFERLLWKRSVLSAIASEDSADDDVSSLALFQRAIEAFSDRSADEVDNDAFSRLVALQAQEELLVILKGVCLALAAPGGERRQRAATAISTAISKHNAKIPWIDPALLDPSYGAAARAARAYIEAKLPVSSFEASELRLVESQAKIESTGAKGITVVHTQESQYHLLFGGVPVGDTRNLVVNMPRGKKRARSSSSFVLVHHPHDHGDHGSPGAGGAAPGVAPAARETSESRGRPLAPQSRAGLRSLDAPETDAQAPVVVSATGRVEAFFERLRQLVGQ